MRTSYPPEAHGQDDFEELLTPLTDGVRLTNSQQHQNRFFRPWFIHGACFCLYTIAFFAVLVQLRSPTLARCVSLTSAYSPLLESVEYETIVFNGTLNYSSIYRGPPSPDIDAVWDKVTHDVYSTSITTDTLLKVGKTVRPSSVKFPEEKGGGYMALYEVSHQLHCLNLLRKYSYREYYAPITAAFFADPVFFRTHLDHCIEMLRQTLMCNADAGLVTFDWVAGFPTPYPDFNTLHRCRNFDRIMDWIGEHAIDVQVVRTGDEVEMEVAP